MWFLVRTLLYIYIYIYIYSQGSQYFRLTNSDSNNGDSVFSSSPGYIDIVFSNITPLALSTPDKSLAKTALVQLFPQARAQLSFALGLSRIPAACSGNGDWLIDRCCLLLFSIVRPCPFPLSSSCVLRPDASLSAQLHPARAYIIYIPV